MDFVRAIQAANIKPVIDQVFPLGRARDAYDHLASGKHFGKVVVVRVDG